MAHMIDMSTGKPAIAYSGATPWHGLGIELPEDQQDLGVWRVSAGLDWEAHSAPVQYVAGDGDGELLQVPERRVLYRSDTKTPLGVVSDSYRAVQPREVIDFYRDLVESHGFKLHTAGSLREGRRIWALAKTGIVERFKGQDEVGAYLLLCTSFDGTMATTARFTSVRVVCQNTLHLATKEHSDAVSVPHNAKFDGDAVKIKLGIGDAFAEWSKSVEQLCERQVSPQETIEYLLRVYHGITAEQVDDSNRSKVEKTIARLGGHLLSAPGSDMRSARGTAWGLVNAVTYDIDHSAKAKAADTRLNNAWFGNGARTKAQAFAEALKLAA